MAELDHASLAHVIQSGGATENVSHLPYAKSLDQHTRVKDRDEALQDLKDKHPEALREQLNTTSETGRMLFDRGDPLHILFNPDNPYNRIMHTLIPGGGRRSLSEVLGQAAVTIKEVQNALDPGMVDAVKINGDNVEVVTDQLKVSTEEEGLEGVVDIIALPLAEHLKIIENNGATKPYISEIIVFSDEDQKK